MAFNEQISDRIREALADAGDVEEKLMFGGVCYMVNGKMCVGVMGDEMMCRIDPEKMEEAMEKSGSRQMDFTGRPMKGMVLVDELGLKRNADFKYWIDLCLQFNPKAKASKKKM